MALIFPWQTGFIWKLLLHPQAERCNHLFLHDVSKTSEWSRFNIFFYFNSQAGHLTAPETSELGFTKIIHE